MSQDPHDNTLYEGLANGNGGEILPLPEKLYFLLGASTAEMSDWIFNHDYSDLRVMIPTVWHLMKLRIRDYPNEARQECVLGRLPINGVLHMSASKREKAPPLSLLQLLIEVYPQGLCIQDLLGRFPLHNATLHTNIDCVRAVLRGSPAEAFTTQDILGRTPLHMSTLPNAALATTWELLLHNCKCITLKTHNNETALQMSDRDENWIREQQYIPRQHARRTLLKMITYYNHVPPLPTSNEEIKRIESHPACTVLAHSLEPGSDAFIVHRALRAKCPLVFVESLVQIFPHQVAQPDNRDGRLPLHVALASNHGASVRLVAAAYPAALEIVDSISGLLPIEQALLNAGTDGSIENVDAVDALLRADPAFLMRTGCY